MLQVAGYRLQATGCRLQATGCRLQVAGHRLQVAGYRLQAAGCRLKGGEMQSYKDLDVYQLSHKLAVEIHKMTLEDLPKFEMYEEGSQIRRSSKSIPSNIVEGFGKKYYQQEYIRHLTYAVASCDETKEHLEILVETNSLRDKNKFTTLYERYEQLGRKLYNFRQSIQQG